MSYRFLLSAGLALLLNTAVAIKPSELQRYKPKYTTAVRPVSSSSIAAISMPFNEAVFSNPAELSRVRGKSVRRVTLYYSAFQVANSFSQPALNLARFEAMQRALPELFSNSGIEWNICGQVTHHLDSAKHFFHGFVIEFVPLPSAAETVSDIKNIEHLMSSDSLGHDTLQYTESWRVVKKKRWTGLFKPKSKRKQAQGIVYRHRTFLNRKKMYVTIVDTLRFRNVRKKFIPSPVAMSFVRRCVLDTTVLAVMNRHRDWNNMLMVVDVTGSMSPYTAQLFLWHKLNHGARNMRGFVFFNDGDNKSDRLKRIGHTGGVRFSDDNSPEHVLAKGSEAMMAGCGGDAPENNCEALLEALQRYPDVTEIFMIADNFANMRDNVLASKIKVPVHIILCWADNGFINTQYLDLARITGGSVHTIDEDIDMLMQLKEGQKLTLGGKEYIIRKGKFELFLEL